MYLNLKKLILEQRNVWYCKNKKIFLNDPMNILYFVNVRVPLVRENMALSIYSKQTQSRSVSCALLPPTGFLEYGTNPCTCYYCFAHTTNLRITLN